MPAHIWLPQPVRCKTIKILLFDTPTHQTHLQEMLHQSLPTCKHTLIVRPWLMLFYMWKKESSGTGMNSHPAQRNEWIGVSKGPGYLQVFNKWHSGSHMHCWIVPKHTFCSKECTALTYARSRLWNHYSKYPCLTFWLITFIIKINARVQSKL